jgi:hypothetical protein
MSQGSFPIGWSYQVESIHNDDEGWSGAPNWSKVEEKLKASDLSQMEKVEKKNKMSVQIRPSN